jgi:hypothetical protein
MIAMAPIMDYFKDTKDLTYYYFYFPLVTLIVIFTSIISIKKQIKILQSYELKINDGSISREQDNTQTISIPFTDIKLVKITRNGNIVIQGNNKYDTIMVYKNTTDYDELLSHLTSLEGVATKTNQQLVPKNKIPFIIASAFLPIIIYSSYNKMLVGISGLLLAVLMTYSTIEVYKIKNIDDKTKQIMWAMPLILIVTIAITIYKVFIL